MRVVPIESGYFVRLDLGEEIVGTLTALVKERQITGGSITGIGAVKSAELGYFDVHRKEYAKRTFEDDMELVAMNGNITWLEDGEPMIHAHALLSGADLTAVGGHLFSAEIAVTGEVFIQTHDSRLERKPDKRTGLKLIG